MQPESLHPIGNQKRPSLVTELSANPIGNQKPGFLVADYGSAESGGAPQWSGRISSADWRFGTDVATRRYVYSYDGHGRLVSAGYYYGVQYAADGRNLRAGRLVSNSLEAEPALSPNAVPMAMAAPGLAERAEVFECPTDYVGNLVYKSGVLDKILVDRGLSARWSRTTTTTRTGNPSTTGPRESSTTPTSGRARNGTRALAPTTSARASSPPPTPAGPPPTPSPRSTTTSPPTPTAPGIP